MRQFPVWLATGLASALSSSSSSSQATESLNIPHQPRPHFHSQSQSQPQLQSQAKPRSIPPSIPKSIPHSSPSSSDHASRSNPSTEPLSFPIVRHTKPQVPHLDRRDTKAKDLDIPVTNLSSVIYHVEIQLGTPGQKVQVSIDTGSNELWVNPDCANAPEGQVQDCQAEPRFVPAKSSTIEEFDTSSEIQYGLGHVEMDYVSDTMSLPGSDIAIANQTFGVASSTSDISTGIFGLGFGNGLNLNYNSFLDNLVDQNIISTRLFSVALGSKEEEEGSGLLTFGGIDVKKFTGPLHTERMLGQLYPNDLYRYWIRVQSVGLTATSSASRSNNNKTYENTTFAAFLDTGSTLSYFPSPLIQDLITDFDAQFVDQYGLYLLKCRDVSGTLDVTLGDGYTIHVPLSDFLWQLSDTVCALGADIGQDESYILGASFMRSVYTVFDLDRELVHLAPYANCGSEAQAVAKDATNATFASSQFAGQCSADDAVRSSSDDRDDGSSLRHPKSLVRPMLAAMLSTLVMMSML